MNGAWEEYRGRTTACKKNSVEAFVLPGITQSSEDFALLEPLDIEMRFFYSLNTVLRSSMHLSSYDSA
jgi:hypothetical protein